MHTGSPQWVTMKVTEIGITKKGLTLEVEHGGPSRASPPNSQVLDPQGLSAQPDPESPSTGPSRSREGVMVGGFSALLPSSRSEQLESAPGCSRPHSQPKSPYCWP